MTAKQFLNKYIEYLYSGTRCFEMDAAFENEAEALETITAEYNQDPETIREWLQDDIDSGVFEEAAEMLEMFQAIA